VTFEFDAQKGAYLPLSGTNSLECGDLSPLSPKRRQAGALQNLSGSQRRLLPCSLVLGTF